MTKQQCCGPSVIRVSRCRDQIRASLRKRCTCSPSYKRTHTITSPRVIEAENHCQCLQLRECKRSQSSLSWQATVGSYKLEKAI